MCRTKCYLNVYYMEGIQIFNDNTYREISFSNFPIHYHKLLKKLCCLNASGICHVEENIGGILDVDVISFNSLLGVGPVYTSLLIALQSELKHKTDSYWIDKANEREEINKRGYRGVDFCIIPESLFKLCLNLQFLDKKSIRLLTKLKILFGLLTVKDIFYIDPEKLKRNNSIGKLSLSRLQSLQKNIKLELIKLTENNLQLTLQDSSIFTSIEAKFYQIEDIEKCLLEDIDSYLCFLNEKHKDIALSRWGFNHKRKTLVKIGIKYDRTKEAIRQTGVQINTNLPSYFRIHPKILRENIQKNIEHSHDLKICFPRLSKCFVLEKHFFSFLEVCCQIKKGSINVVMNDNRSLLDSSFAIPVSPFIRGNLIENQYDNPRGEI